MYRARKMEKVRAKRKRSPRMKIQRNFEKDSKEVACLGERVQALMPKDRQIARLRLESKEMPHQNVHYAER